MAIKREFVDFLRRSRLMGFANFVFNLRNIIIKAVARLTGKSDIDIVYNKDFFLENITLTEDSARKSVEIIMDYFKPKRVIDFGCGPGIFLREFEKRGVKILGIDGSKHARDNAVIDKDKILLMDLRKDIEIKEKFDLTICFEVAEHLDNKYSKNLVKNVTKNSDIILFTAAKKGQGGTDHVNEQKPEFWVRLFRERNFYLDESITSELKNKMFKTKIIWWIPENLMIFKRINHKIQ
jgi:SAM-dependent methyltransferase